MFDDGGDGDGEGPLADFVEPSAELLALWAADDVRHEDPAVRAAEYELFVEREAFFEALARMGDQDPSPCEGMDLAPGSAALAQWAGSLDCEELVDYELVELVAAMERVASWAKARQLTAIEALSRQASMNPKWLVTVAQPCVAGDEIAARLGTSRYAGRDLLEAGQLLTRQLMATGNALEDGDLDWGKAKIIIAALKDIPWQVAQVVEDVVLPTAAERTPTQLRGDLQKALIAVDAEDAEQRTARAVDTRRVCKPKVLPDGLAGIWSVLPAPIATAIDTALTDAARKAQRGGDTRTIDQLRADAFTGTLLGDDECTCEETGKTCDAGQACDTGQTCDPSGTSNTGGTSGTSGTSPAATGSSLGAEPAISAESGSELVSELGASAGTSGTAARTEPTASTEAPSVSRCPAPAAGTGGFGRIAGQIRIDVTVSLATLLGMDEDPAQLAGYGAITAQTARRLAANGTWRRLVTDPQSGTVLDVGKTRYRPPDDLAEIVRARDPYCISPFCNAASRNCDLDHRVPFNPDGSGGATSEENLAPACRRDHLLKTHAGWHYDRAENGTITWTTPTGHKYIYKSPRLPGHERFPQVEHEPGFISLRAPKPKRTSEADDPPPF